MAYKRTDGRKLDEHRKIYAEAGIIKKANGSAMFKMGDTIADAGSRCAGICAASIALADAGIKMKDMVAAVSFGKVEGQMIIDPDYIEDSMEGGTDVPLAMIPSTGEITLMQLDGDITQKEIQEGIKKLKPVIEEIAKAQRDALRNKFKKG
jgi:exosome complex component RRP41